MQKSFRVKKVQTNHTSKGTFCLDAPVHSQKCSMDAVQIVQHLVVEFCKFLIDTDNPVIFALMALFSMRTSRAVFALVEFFCTAKPVSFHRCRPKEMESLTIGADHISLVV